MGVEPGQDSWGEFLVVNLTTVLEECVRGMTPGLEIRATTPCENVYPVAREWGRPLPHPPYEITIRRLATQLRSSTGSILLSGFLRLNFDVFLSRRLR